MIRVIAGRELRALFVSPIAWLVLASVQFILAYVFLARIEIFMEVQPRLAVIDGAPGITEIIITPVLGSVAVILLLLAPLLTMRTFSEERRSGTLNLLLTAPISVSDIVLGKFCGLIGFFAIMLAMIALMPLALTLGGTIDIWQFVSGLFGVSLLAASFTAVGLFMSALTRHPGAAAVASFGLLLLLWIVQWRGATSAQTTTGVVDYLSLTAHFQPLLTGRIDSSDVCYFLLLIVTFLILTIWRLGAERLWAT